MIITGIIGAICYRIRGGAGNSIVQKLLHKPAGWEIPNTYIRLPFAIFVTVMTYLHGLPLYWLPVVLALAFAGVATGYFNGEFNLALPENRNWRNYARLSLRGAWIIFPVAVLLSAFNINLWYAVGAGALFVPCYLLGYLINSRYKYMGGSQYGEMLVGGLIGACL